MPTGTTPRKRTWDFNDKWQLTKTREALLQEHQRQPSIESARFVPEPSSSSVLASEDVREAVESESEAAESATDYEEDASSQASQAEEDPDTTIRMSPPIPAPLKSLESSTSSSSSSSRQPVLEPRPPPPAALRRPSYKRKSLLPVKGTLTERSTNLLSGRPSKRLR